MGLRPEILRHSQIPKALHGVSPRNIIGKYLWDTNRAKIIHEQEHVCKACGVHEKLTKYGKKLEIHEVYEINYQTGEVKFMEFVAICNFCHSFIHAGLLKIRHITGKISKKMYEEIMIHGINLLSQNALAPDPYTFLDWLYHTESLSNIEVQNRLTKYQKEQKDIIDRYNVKWSDWHLVFDGKKYYSKFKDLEDWKKFYRR